MSKARLTQNDDNALNNKRKTKREKRKTKGEKRKTASVKRKSKNEIRKTKNAKLKSKKENRKTESINLVDRANKKHQCVHIFPKLSQIFPKFISFNAGVHSLSISPSGLGYHTGFTRFKQTNHPLITYS